MKQRLATALVLTCAALFAQSVGAAQPVSIGNYGEDGDGIFYGVICDDNSEGSVIKRIEPHFASLVDRYANDLIRTDSQDSGSPHDAIVHVLLHDQNGPC